MNSFFKNNKVFIALIITLSTFFILAMMSRIHNIFSFISMIFFAVSVFLTGVLIQMRYNIVKSKVIQTINLNSQQIERLNKIKKREITALKVQYIALYIISALLLYFNFANYLLN